MEKELTGTARILVYSDDHAVREAVRLALGKKLAADLPELEIIEAATQPAVLKEMDSGLIDLAILDGEATPAGGMGLAHQLKDEVAICPPIMVLVIRAADAWLATWSRAEAIATLPVDPINLPRQAAALLRIWFADEPDDSVASSVTLLVPDEAVTFDDAASDVVALDDATADDAAAAPDDATQVEIAAEAQAADTQAEDTLKATDTKVTK